MELKPKCLTFTSKEFKGAAYTADGFMLPCCWMDDPVVYNYIVLCGLKKEELKVKNNDKLEDIFTSPEWENFFSTLVNNPIKASYMCKKKCGINITKDDEAEIKKEELFAVGSIKIEKNNR
jgi:hypothetical protein